MEKIHLTLQDRQSIEQMLNAGKKFTEIALALDKNKSTISREVRAYNFFIRVGAIGIGYNACKNRYGCKKTHVCNTCNSPKKFKICRRCSMCNMHCPDFEKEVCSRHIKPPATPSIVRKISNGLSWTIMRRNTRCC